ncbi:MAG: hypothetical protein H7Z42_01355 [Roseiflexaceae bacterium]|nr:hypothetical protein [Roseiflexaceae bacterium]
MTLTKANPFADLPATPQAYQAFRDLWANAARRGRCLEAYASGRVSFVPNLLPELALAMPGAEVLALLRRRYGTAVDDALAEEHADPDELARLPEDIQSPVISAPDAAWLKTANMVGINLRTIGSFWNIVKYALTLPEAQDSIHLLPIWEPGVVGSLYGMSSWQLNDEFFSSELAELCPWLDSSDRQLRAVVNLLHMTGRTVGMDVIPHTDRFSEMALAFPEHFEWLQRQDAAIITHSAQLHEAVQDTLVAFVQANGPALAGLPVPAVRAALFGADVGEEQRNLTLFGPPEDAATRNARRNQLIAHLARYGFEPVPATMAPPYRGMQVDLRPEARSVDGSGMVWREYSMTNPTSMSRVFGPLARYHLYESGAGWQLDFSRPRVATWAYICEHYAQAQRRYGFDFMRGDMAHVQMRPAGVPDTFDEYYDILGAVKQYIAEGGAPFFGYFAETFLAPRDVMAYGEEIDHLEAAEADTTLGDLQATVLGSAEFLRRLRAYDDLRTTRQCTPAFTIMTADKDDPRFDLFYRTGGEARLFIGLFLADTPSYMGLGFETRDVHIEPAPNEHYTKLYVFHETAGPKAVTGPYVWGHNGALFGNLSRLRLFAESVWGDIAERSTRWLIAPDAMGENPLLAWTQRENAALVFVVNTHAERAFERVAIPASASGSLRCVFSTHAASTESEPLANNGKQHILTQLAPGEGRVYRVE